MKISEKCNPFSPIPSQFHPNSIPTYLLSYLQARFCLQVYQNSVLKLSKDGETDRIFS